MEVSHAIQTHPPTHSYTHPLILRPGGEGEASEAVTLGRISPRFASPHCTALTPSPHPTEGGSGGEGEGKGRGGEGRGRGGRKGRGGEGRGGEGRDSLVKWTHP